MEKTGHDECLIGAWKLNYFLDHKGETRHHYTDIIIFSRQYYSDFHEEKGETELTLSHVGMYRVSEDTITFQIQLSTHPEYIGKVATGLYRCDSDELRITVQQGRHPGVWVYSRI